MESTCAPLFVEERNLSFKNIEVKKSQSEAFFRIRLEISATPVPGSSLERLTIELVGDFSTHDDAPVDQLKVSIPNDCVETLYRAVRDMVHNLTAIVPGGPVWLPDVDIADKVREFAREKLKNSRRGLRDVG